jgi:hypothetical protein
MRIIPAQENKDVQNFLKGSGFTARKLTDTPTDDLQVVNKKYVDDEIANVPTSSPGGSNTQVQFNDGGSFGGSAGIRWNKTDEILTLGSDDNLYGLIDTPTGGSIDIVVASAVGANNGGGIGIFAGDSGLSGNRTGGSIDLLAGQGNDSGSGGDINIAAGEGRGTNPVGGNVVLEGATEINPGDVIIKAGDDGTASSASTLGGRIVFTRTNHGFIVKKYYGNKSTTDGTPTTIISHPISASSSNFFTANVHAIRTSGSAGSAQDGASYTFQALYKRVGTGSPTLVGSVLGFTAEDQSGWDSTFVTSGNNVNLQATGATDNNISWISELTVMNQLS